MLSVGVRQPYGTLSPSKQLRNGSVLTKNKQRARRSWPQKSEPFDDRDYQTGRELTGTWRAKASQINEKPLAGSPEFKTIQWDKSLKPE